MSDELGVRLRAAREARGMSLRALAGAIGVSPSLLSQVETGRTKPSVSTLYALVSQLGISTDLLLGREEVPVEAFTDPHASITPPAKRLPMDFKHQPERDNPTLEMDNGVKWERLSYFPETDVEALRATYQPGASSSTEGRFMYHFGLEHVYMISGELTLHLDLDAHVIKGGESAVFNAERPHLFVNASNEPAVGVWYIFGRDAAAQAALGTHHLAPPATSSEGQVVNAVDVLHNFRQP
ncbi:helix-turn-helix domain-containing protein [Tessaracoccus sp. MC1756]|uniref:helix-turn-helix domain-containing protein n=1 Tax=Tessaracoccus sp. MC1756 TaxID=2760311 RepID=UPI0015FEEE2A|nr:XRE family transcriptional regulator [Tessaracoccus sp. MC1756]MBB1510930.1 helix-turn-helix transcriptional regulator [Tessaracoccus sp. MC1756]